MGEIITDGKSASYASKSDADLRVLESDGSLSAEAREAVADELRHRQQRYAATPAPVSSTADDDASINRALERLRAVLVPGEELQAFAVQRRLFALTHRRVLVAATSGRLITVSRGLLGGFTPHDIRWQDITDASLRVGTFGADLTVASHGSEDLASADRVSNSVTVTGLREKQAGDVYRVCQTQEQAWREKRRVRDLDELRARSGGIQLGASMNAAGPATGDDDPVARLRRAKEMLDNHLITDSEYESIKAKIVDRL